MHQLADIAQTLHGSSIVDFGCGSSPYRNLFQSQFHNYIAADLPGNPDADIALHPDGTLPLPNESVDAVLSSQVLEHVTDPDQYLSEACRVLSKKGTMILSTHGIWPYHPDPNDFWRWTPDGLARIVQNAGLEVIQMRSILGQVGTALQLLQDGLSPRVPRGMRSFFTAVMQAGIGLGESLRRSDSFSANGCVFILVAVPSNRDAEGRS